MTFFVTCRTGVQEGHQGKRARGHNKEETLDNWYTIYCITCQQNGRRYIGITNNYKRRRTEHKRHPPFKMREDVERYKPFEDCFGFESLFVCRNLDVARVLEQTFIRKYNSMGPCGYNVLRAHPPICKKYAYLKKIGKI